MDELAQSAARWGIETGYFDVQGRRHEADAETLGRLIEALSGGENQPESLEDRAGHPIPAWQGDGRRCWVLAVQLYGMRSGRNWGHGDFSDLAALLKIVADLGGAGIGLNPLHAQFYPNSSGSPYSPSSRLFLNPLYIDVEAIEGFKQRQAEEIRRLRDTELVDYPAVAKLKIIALRQAFDAFAKSRNGKRRAEFDAYRRERGRELACFAAFETLRQEFPGPWREWPEEWRICSDMVLHRLRETRPRDMEFHEFLQWKAEKQLEKCRTIARERGMSIGLYLDTAIGVDPGGADSWMEQGTVLQRLSVGAPPDQFNPAGQDWGLTAYNPHGLVARNFEPFRQMLRAAMRYAGAVRIDHVLGLMRLFVIPHGFPASRGAYIRLPFADMLAMVSEESRRWNCITIGEDLGTVPDGFRDKLAAWGVWSYLVMLFERDGNGVFKPPDRYREFAIATLNTHDLATFAGWIGGHDLAVKRAIGVDPGETGEDRENSRNALKTALGKGQPSFDDIAEFLAATPTRLVSISVEDILGLEDQVNVPGTVDEHPNWRRRCPKPVEELASDQRLRRIAEMFSRAGRGAAPAS